jgi:hypothetical protein
MGRGLQNSIQSQIRAFFVGFGFLAKRLWPIGYVALRKTGPTKKSSNLTREASFAIPSGEKIDLEILYAFFYNTIFLLI